MAHLSHQLSERLCLQVSCCVHTAERREWWSLYLDLGGLRWEDSLLYSETHRQTKNPSKEPIKDVLSPDVPARGVGEVRTEI